MLNLCDGLDVKLEPYTTVSDKIPILCQSHHTSSTYTSLCILHLSNKNLEAFGIPQCNET